MGGQSELMWLRKEDQGSTDFNEVESGDCCNAVGSLFYSEICSGYFLLPPVVC